MDFSTLPNPYDFANPVDDPDLFVGRRAEIDEIEYYLDHANKASRPINLAIIGARASGKTSFLNMIEIEAKKREFCVVRVNLDEADAQSQLAFFYKIFDSILTESCSLNAFGGLTGKTYETYCDIVSTYEIPEENIFCPFIFPIRYAKAMNKGNIDIALPDTNFKRDISLIQKELQRPIAILFDECDVLNQSRVHLQKLRNIFMNAPGFMLVVTGTPALFPIIDEIFSPIIRQFKKINVVPFTEEEDTEDCIRNPLSKIGIKNPAQIFDFETYYDVSEIHDMTGGRPYEIQLLCHFLFRRVQEGRARNMKLTLDVLDDVLSELRTSQDISVRPIITSVRNFNTKQLTALAKLCACDGVVDFEQIWFNEYVFWGDAEWTREGLEHQLNEFKELGIIRNDPKITFAGDDFDRIYCKYLARKHFISININDMPYEILLAITSLDTLLAVKGIEDILLSRTINVGRIDKLDVQEFSKLIEDEGAKNPFATDLGVAQEIYWANIDFRNEDSFHIAAVTISTTWTTVRRWFRCQSSDEEHLCILEELSQALIEPAERAKKLDGEITVEIYELPVIPISKVIERVKSSKKASEDVFQTHVREMLDAYFDGNFEMACFHGELGFSIVPQSQLANNLGYLYLIQDNLSKAKEYLGKSLELAKDTPSMALPNYNLGVTYVKEGQISRALEKFELAKKQLVDASDEHRICEELVKLNYSINSKSFEYERIKDPDISETAHAGILAINQLELSE